MEAFTFDRFLSLVLSSSSFHSSPSLALLKRQADSFIERSEFQAAKSTLLDILRIDAFNSEALLRLSTFSSENVGGNHYSLNTEKERDHQNAVVPLALRKEYALRVLELSSTSSTRHHRALVSLGRIYREEGTKCIKLPFYTLLSFIFSS